MTAPGDANLAHLLGRLAVIHARVRAIVAARRRDDPAPDDPFRGLYLSDQQVDRLLAPAAAAAPESADAAALLNTVERAADAAARAGADLRLRRLASGFGLDPVAVELLLVALAPDLHSHFEGLYGYLNDDVTRRRATIGLAIELCGGSPAAAPFRARLTAAGPLAGGGLLLVEEPERPFLTRSLRVPDRVTAHLLGDDRPDPLIEPLLAQGPPWAGGGAGGLTRALRTRARLCYLRERPGGSGRALAAAALQEAGLPALVLDLGQLDAHSDLHTVAKVAAREARLRGGGIVAGPVEVLAERGAGAVRMLAEAAVPVLLAGRGSWDPSWSAEVPLTLEVPVPSAAERAELWRSRLDGDAPEGLEGLFAAQFRLAPEQVARAVTAARLQASLDGERLTTGHLRGGARAQNGAGLERLARRIPPAVGWGDLVLPATALEQLRELATRARHRDQVLRTWAMRPGGARGQGITALFAGDSGTGKTMSAEVIAAELGLDLYAVDLATVVDKYVGETEKNLERIFAEAAGVNGVLLFDEADAIFGKRSEVHDAHDRYANVETAYLLQRMETFDGLAILATNLRANVDEAFTRRLDVIVDFPTPDRSQRRLLWERCLAPPLPLDQGVDLDFCARAFELSGGSIRSAAVTAAYLAAESGKPVGMADLIRAIHREYRKLGRLCLEAEFGPYHALLSA